MKNILSKYTEELSNKRAKAIEDFVMSHIPKWQKDIMVRFPFSVKLFGWLIELQPPSFSSTEEIVRLKRWGKLVGTLKINLIFKPITKS